MKTLTDRFFSKVSKGPECWNWTGVRVGRNRDGYGQFWMNGKRIYANRVSWILHNGEIPKGLFVLHDCDNKSCVRPEHLHLGTTKQNMIEAAERGFKAKKLNTDQVRAIRKLKGSLSSHKVALMYGVEFSTVCDIWRGSTWSHLK